MASWIPKKPWRIKGALFTGEEGIVCLQLAAEGPPSEFAGESLDLPRGCSGALD